MVTRAGFGVLVVAAHVGALVVGLLGATGVGLSALATVGLIGLLVFVGWDNDSPADGPGNSQATGTGDASGTSDAARRDVPIGGALSEE